MRKLRFRGKEYNFLCGYYHQYNSSLSAFEIAVFKKRESDCSNKVSSSLQDKTAMARGGQIDNTDIAIGSHTQEFPEIKESLGVRKLLSKRI